MCKPNCASWILNVKELEGSFSWSMDGCQKYLSVDQLWQKPNVSVLNLLFLNYSKPHIFILVNSPFSCICQLHGCVPLVGGWFINFILNFIRTKEPQTLSSVFFLCSPITFQEGVCRAHRIFSTMIWNMMLSSESRRMDQWLSFKNKFSSVLKNPQENA